MKKLITIVATILLITPFFGGSLYAQDDTETTVESEDFAGQAFELDISKGTQSIFNDSVPIYLDIQSYIKTTKLQVRWKLPTGLQSKGNVTAAWGTIEKDGEVSTSIEVTPEKPGTYKLVAEVQAWQADANYVDTVSIDLTFEKDLEITPHTDQYYQNQRTWNIAKIAMIVLGLGLAGVLGVLGYKAFIKWLSED